MNKWSEQINKLVNDESEPNFESLYFLGDFVLHEDFEFDGRKFILNQYEKKMDDIAQNYLGLSK